MLLWNCMPGHLSQRKENLGLHQKLYTDIHSTFICKRINWKQYRFPSTGGQMNYNAPIPSNSTQNQKNTQSLEESSKIHVEWKRQSLKLTWCDSMYITFLRWQNLKIGEKIIGCQELMSASVGMGGKWCGYKKPTGEIF